MFKLPKVLWGRQLLRKSTGHCCWGGISQRAQWGPGKKGGDQAHGGPKGGCARGAGGTWDVAGERVLTTQGLSSWVKVWVLILRQWPRAQWTVYLFLSFKNVLMKYININFNISAIFSVWFSDIKYISRKGPTISCGLLDDERESFTLLSLCQPWGVCKAVFIALSAEAQSPRIWRHWSLLAPGSFIIGKQSCCSLRLQGLGS